MKHFANCTPDEFMSQVVKFRGPFVDWVKETGILEIRARRPEGYEDMEKEEKIKAITKMATENTGEIISIALEKNPEATKNLMCLATFTDPKDFNNHTMVEYLTAIMQMLGNTEVKDFFTFYLTPAFKNGLNG
jgi:hypothetical protein